MDKIREYFVVRFFIRMGNGKFLVFEGAFIYMIIACAILTWGVLEFYNEWSIIPFLIPFLYGVYLFIFAPKVTFIDDLEPHWRTQLMLLKDPKMYHFNTQYDREVQKRLELKWQSEYGERFEDMTFAKFQKWHPVALTVICLTIYLIWGIS